MRATGPTLHMHLDLITLFGEVYKLRSSSLRSLLQSPVTSSFLRSAVELDIILRSTN